MPSSEAHAGDHGLDVLGAVAIVVVTTLAGFSQVYPPWAYPAAGLIAAVWGARTAAALDTGNHQPLRVTAHQLVGILPPVWIVGLVTLPVIGRQGWPGPSSAAGTNWNREVLLTWLIPLAEPRPGDPGYHELAGRLWLVRALVWLTLLAPVLVFCVRTWTYRTTAVVMVLMAATTAGALGEQTGLATELGLSVGVLGGPWLLGVAHQDGRVRCGHPGWVVPAGVSLITGGVWCFTALPDEWDADQGATPRGLGASAALALGVTLLALRFAPTLARLPTHRQASRVVDLLRRRMLTLYLWAGTCGFLTTVMPRPPWVDGLPWPDAGWATCQVAVTWAGALAAAAVLGWVEDLGADRLPPAVSRRGWARHATASTATASGEDGP
jgi:hypothetical protein